MESVVRNRNANLLKDLKPTVKKTLSCRQKPECPSDEKCLSQCVAYHAIISKPTIDKVKHHHRTCKSDFKERYNNHTTSFRGKSKDKSKELPT